MATESPEKLLTPVLSAHWDKPDAWTLETYKRHHDGYAGLAKALATEFGPEGITVNCIAPGLIDTQRVDVTPHTKRTNALKKKGRPEDIAAMVRLLCGPDGHYITGQTLHVNGGALMV